MKKIYCGQCVWAVYKKDQGGYFCESPLLDEKKLIKVCQKYQLGIVSPRWCPKKERNKQNGTR